MKNNQILIIVSMIALISFLAITNSCQKEVTVNPGKITPSSRDIYIGKIIGNFRDKVNFIRQNPDYKSGETIQPDSALWYLEATFNFSHAFPNEHYYRLKADTIYISLTANTEGAINFTDLALKYFEMKEVISNVYYNSGFEEKGLVSVDLEEELSYQNSEILFKVISVTGEKNNNIPPAYGIDGPFVEGDDWWYGEMAGHCDSHTWDSDAAQQLMIAMNNYIPDPNGNYVFVNLFQKELMGGDPEIRRTGDPEPVDNQFDYYLYSASETIGPVDDDILCLSYPEMNQYFSYLKYLLFTKLPQDMPTGYGIVTVIDMSGTWNWIENQLYRKYYHKGLFQYGERIYIASSPEEL